MKNINWESNLSLAEKIANKSRINVGIELHDEGELTFDGWVSIRAEDRKVCIKSIAHTRVIVATRYILEITKVNNNYPFEPDDVDTEELSHHKTVEDAIKNALLVIVENHLDHVIENINMESFLAEEKNMEVVR